MAFARHNPGKERACSVDGAPGGGLDHLLANHVIALTSVVHSIQICHRQQVSLLKYLVYRCRRRDWASVHRQSSRFLVGPGMVIGRLFSRSTRY